MKNKIFKYILACVICVGMVSLIVWLITVIFS